MSYLSFRAKANMIAVGIHGIVCFAAAYTGMVTLAAFCFFFTMISWYSASFYVQLDFERQMLQKAKEIG